MVGVPVAIMSRSEFPFSSYWTLVTPGDEVASRYRLPDNVAPFEGSTTVVVGGALFTVMVMPGLVPRTPPAYEATLWSVYVPFGTLVVFQLANHP